MQVVLLLDGTNFSGPVVKSAGGRTMVMVPVVRSGVGSPVGNSTTPGLVALVR